MESKVARRQKGAVTIQDVARRAGVSPMTVSRVINGERNVREAKRQAVDAAIRELNYAPNPAAQSLAGGEFIRLGLLYSNPSSAYLSEFLVGSLDQCSRANIQLAVEKCGEAQDEAIAIQRLVASGVDGMLLPPPLCDSEAVLAAVLASDTPAVMVATGRPRPGISSVRIDDFAAAYEITRHLLDLGHRRIGFIKGHPNQTASAERLRGYRAALEAAGVAPEADRIVQGYFTYRSGLDAAGQLLSLPEPPTAVFASNDDMAAATIAVAHARGLDVPGDVSVCGYDDTALATTVWPELTTVRQPIAEMAREAVTILAQMIRARRTGAAQAPVDLLLPHALIRRQSEAAPGKSTPG